MNKLVLALLLAGVLAREGVTQGNQYDTVVKVTPNKIYVQIRSGKTIETGDIMVIIRTPEESSYERIADVRVSTGGARFAEVKVIESVKGKSVKNSDLLVSEAESRVIRERARGGVPNRAPEVPLYPSRQEPSLAHRAKIKIQLRTGAHNIHNELEPDPGNSAMGALYIGYAFSANSTIGLHISAVHYTVAGAILTKDELLLSSFAAYRYSFRSRHALRPYLELGLGITDPIPTYDSGNKLASLYAVGLEQDLSTNYAILLENRGQAWRQTNREGRDIVVGAHEFSIALSRAF